LFAFAANAANQLLFILDKIHHNDTVELTVIPLLTECTYDKPSNRRRNPAPQYIEALEGRLQRAEALLRKFIPDVDLSDPTLDPSVQQEFQNRENARSQTSRAQSAQLRAAPANDAQLTSMIDSIGQLDLDERGGWDFHGNSSGSVFLKRMRENFRGLLGPQTKLPFLPRAERPQGVMGLDSPSPGSAASFMTSGTPNDLPPKDQARSLCYYSLSCATCLVRIVHVPSFYAKFEQVYDKAPETLSLEESRFLGLVYAVLALGCMYKNLDDATTNKIAYKESLDEGYVSQASYQSPITDDLLDSNITRRPAPFFRTLQNAVTLPHYKVFSSLSYFCRPLPISVPVMPLLASPSDRLCAWAFTEISNTRKSVQLNKKPVVVSSL
jgi:hypothetical protein